MILGSAHNLKGPRRELLLTALRQHFSDERHIMWAPKFHESIEDLTHVKAGISIGHSNLAPDTVEFTLCKAGLRHIWKPHRSRYAKFGSREVSDPSWFDEAKLFSKHHRRGVKVNHNGLTMEIIDVDRSAHFCRKWGYNDTYTVRFSS